VDFVKNFYDADVRNPELYDLVINTEKLSIIDAVDLIIQALHNIEPPGRHVTLAVTGALKAMTTTNC
jgi:hypothetical protein